MSENIKLRDCPRCGSPAVMISTEDGKFYFAMCTKCGNFLPNCKTEKAAAKAWNEYVNEIFEYREDFKACPFCGGRAVLLNPGHVINGLLSSAV